MKATFPTAHPPGSSASLSVAPRKIQVLLLEDRANDAEMILQHLRRAGYAPEWRRVETEADFDAHLHPRLDVILADYRLPRFDGLTALRRLQQCNLDVPFIIITGTLGDELAARCIKEGVTDYLLKDRLERLGLAVANAIEDRRLRAERHAVEEQLRQAQKMESIGQLAGGIAHDFSNVLTVINGRAAFLLEDKSLAPHLREALREIYSAGTRASSLTRQLLVFSRKQPARRVATRLNDVIDEVVKLLGRIIGERITLGVELDPALPIAEADAGMIEQVLINLAVNARDAMPHGGTLSIATKLVELTAPDAARNPAARAGNFIRLRMTDTGMGIPPAILPRIFEPFFTTKEAGKGTGLGLATVFGIVREHLGWIEVASEVQVGTTFEIFLPIAAAANEQPTPVTLETGIGHARGGRETLLVVEDEPGVRQFAVSVLQHYGYRVLQAGSGRDALEVWARHRERIMLVVTDMVMPDELTGLELAAQLRTEKPDLRVVFTSGYFQDSDSQRFEPADGYPFLHKPYDPAALAAIVRQTLDEAPSRQVADSAARPALLTP